MAHVKQYGIHELCLHARAKKPFDTPLKAHFTAPDGTKITVGASMTAMTGFLSVLCRSRRAFIPMKPSVRCLYCMG